MTPSPQTRPRLGASACLLGEPVRYNGGHSRCRFLTLGPLAGMVEWVAVCPEMELGLGAPRRPVRLLSDGRLVDRDGDTDHSAALAETARRVLPSFEDLDGFVLKSRSPSCGLFGVPRYSAGLPGERTDGQPVDRRGRGAFAEALTAAHPHLPVEEEGRLNDPVLREHFVERVFAHARLRELLSGPWRPRDLVDFHSRHKLQVLAHDPRLYRELGRVVARAGTADRRALAEEYRRLFTEALAVRPTRGRQVNALQHVLGPFGHRLSPERRHGLAGAIEDFQAGRAPMSVPVALLLHDARAENVHYLADQTLLEPFPAALPLRHHL
ncbi:YbgA family protein [Actinocorallia populi]|uniref:YbgA family protein n=1 Tax=Actinocorallia populi TaxID=2079200 RepID=UPI000D08E558|nr:DUF523 and DUF1722 domain-containing protein [Actinocorallia populi]